MLCSLRLWLFLHDIVCHRQAQRLILYKASFAIIDQHGVLSDIRLAAKREVKTLAASFVSFIDDLMLSLLGAIAVDSLIHSSLFRRDISVFRRLARRADHAT